MHYNGARYFLIFFLGFFFLPSFPLPVTTRLCVVSCGFFYTGLGASFFSSLFSPCFFSHLCLYLRAGFLPSSLDPNTGRRRRKRTRMEGGGGYTLEFGFLLYFLGLDVGRGSGFSLACVKTKGVETGVVVYIDCLTGVENDAWEPGR